MENRACNQIGFVTVTIKLLTECFKDEHLRKRYIEWRDKQLAGGKTEEELLTEEQYISQARGVEAKMKNSFKRIGLAAAIFVIYLQFK